jgi:ubiquinone/menaquinone biosynthesis C-methylase UbiE
MVLDNKHTSFGASIPEHYEQYLVPLIFTDYAKSLADSLIKTSGANVLETACGTGIVSRYVARHLDSNSRLIATDLNEPMIEEARSAVGDQTNVEFRQADALDLPFDEKSFDAVLCQFGVMFFPNRVQGYREAARVLKPDGQFLFNVWDSPANNPFVSTVELAVASLYPSDPPKFFDTPFGYHDLELIVRELQEAGFARVDLSVIPLVSEAPSPRHIALGFVAGTPLANTIEERQNPTLDDVVDVAEEALREQFGNGPCRAPMQAIQITASLPDN